MAREYRLELGDNVDRAVAAQMLAINPCFHKPDKPFQEGEIWLMSNLRLGYVEVRVIPRPYGFFLEITSLSTLLRHHLEAWITQIYSLGNCSIVDNDSDESVSVLR